MNALSCPSYAWDRYCAAQDGPYLVGERYETVSPRKQWCASCYGDIPAGARHFRHDQHDDQGRFAEPMRLHLDGECRPYEEPIL